MILFLFPICTEKLVKSWAFSCWPRCNSPALTPFLCGSSLLDQFFLKHTRNNLTPPFPLSKTLWFIHKVSSTGVCGCVCGGWTAPSTDRICHSNQQAEANTTYICLVSSCYCWKCWSVKRRDVGERVTSHWPRSPVSCSRDQMLWMRPACSGWMLLFPHMHWCFCIRESYTRPVRTQMII